MTAHRRVRAVLTLTGLVAASLAAGGCSVPKDPQAKRISRSEVPRFLQDQVLQRNVFLIRGNRLTPVKKAVPLSLSMEKTVASLIEKLREPLSAEDQKAFYTSQIARIASGTPSLQEFDVTLKAVTGNLVTLDVTNAFGIEDNPDALGQLVLTVTDVPGLTRVDFVRGTERLSQVRTSYDSASFVPTPVRKDSFLQPIEVTRGKLYFVAGNRLRPADVDFEGGDLADTPIFTATQYVAALSNVDGIPAGYATLVAGLDATITEDVSGAFILSFSDAYRALSSSDQALAIGQIVKSLLLAPQIPTLPRLELVVDGEPVGTIDPDSYTDLVDSAVPDTDDLATDDTVPS